MVQTVKAFLDGESNLIANLANTSAIINEYVNDINWVGFYLMDKDELVLGPFQGKPACIRIPVGKGVCGTTVEKKETIVVTDVHQFPGHIACDAASRSEIVIPMMKNGEVVGVLDIDSPKLNRFTALEQHYLEAVVKVIEKHLFNLIKSRS
ncbi:MAG: GAF domain-containing protein [Defluviitaleaceae bacterium]|nr:GAF domain-containing protein [Defluviitaleaceae bacterium]